MPPLACPICGLPLPPVEEQEIHVCGACLSDPPPYESHASAYVYRGPVRSLLLLYKERRRYPLAHLLAQALVRAVGRRWPHEQWDVVVGVPSPLRRVMVRGFEPAGLLAAHAARCMGLPHRRFLRLRRAPRTQKGLSAAARRRNLSGAFVADPKVRGLRILLVDDIRTTGATLREASRVLRRAGARVHCATVATTLPRLLDLMEGEAGGGQSQEPDQDGVTEDPRTANSSATPGSEPGRCPP
jgi:ComF family protein